MAKSFGAHIIFVFLQDTILVDGTIAFETWKETPTPVYMQYYVWNLTNREEFLNGGIPVFQDIGPYTYR